MGFKCLECGAAAVSNHKKSGFTLVEISIVLVIIGLVTASVLVGRNLIEAAEMRASITQTERYQLAVKTFQTKYNSLPGDLPFAASLGFIPRSNHGTGVVNGNGLIEATEDNITNQSDMVVGYETLLFWSDLSIAGMIDSQHTTANDGPSPSLMMGEDDSLYTINRVPVSKLGRGNYYFAYSTQTTNYFQLAKALGITSGEYTLSYGISPYQAFSIDKKLDDGLPLTGVVNGLRGVSSLGVACVPSAAAGNGDACCGDNAGGSTNIYKTMTDNLANAQACQMRFRFN